MSGYIFAQPKIFSLGNLEGLTISNQSGNLYDGITVAPGRCIVSSTTGDLAECILDAPISKTVTGSWVAGNNQGGLDTGTVTDATYHCFVIYDPETNISDVLFSAALTPSLPVGFTHYRRVGSIIRAAGWNRQFTQIKNYFQFRPRVHALSGFSISTDGELITMPVPTGIRMQVYGTLTVGQPQLQDDWRHLIILVLDGDLTGFVVNVSSVNRSFNGTSGVSLRSQSPTEALTYVLDGAPNDIQRITNTSGQLYFRRLGEYYNVTTQTSFQVHGYTDLFL